MSDDPESMKPVKPAGELDDQLKVAAMGDAVKLISAVSDPEQIDWLFGTFVIIGISFTEKLCVTESVPQLFVALNVIEYVPIVV